MLRTSIPSETNGSAWPAESIARSIVWSSDAAARFGTDQIDQSGSKPWRSWRKYLARRPMPKALRRLTQAKEPPLEWGTGEADNQPADEQASRRVVFE
jgi:hypothetical protein